MNQLKSLVSNWTDAKRIRRALAEKRNCIALTRLHGTNLSAPQLAKQNFRILTALLETAKTAKGYARIRDIRYEAGMVLEARGIELFA